MTKMPFHRFVSATALTCLGALPVAAWADGSTTFEMAVIDLVNTERANAGLGLASLLFDSRLQEAALFHSKDMAMTPCFSHNSCDGTDTFVRIARFYPGLAGENIAAGYSTPASVVQGWMGSDGHRANILSPDYLGIGVGYWEQAGSPFTHYWTQNFGNLAPPVPEPATTLLWGVGVLAFILARRRSA